MSNTKQTPLQRLIAELNNGYKNFQSILINETLTDENRQQVLIRLVQLKHIKQQAESLLPYEREVIEKAWCDGNDSEPKETPKFYAEQYITQTFQTNENEN